MIRLLLIACVFSALSFSIAASEKELLEAIDAGNVQKVSELLKNNPKLANEDMDSRGTPILYSLVNKRYKVAAAIIEAGADPKVKDHRKENAFHYIAKAGPFAAADLEQVLALIKALKEKGVPINEYSKFGKTPLHFLVLTLVQPKSIPNSKSVLEAMLAAGANPKLELTNEPRIPLVMLTINDLKMGGASAPSSFELLKILIEKGYDVNVTDVEKRSALMLLLMATTIKDEKKIEVATFLIEHNADVKFKNKKDETALKMVDKNSPLYELLKNPPKQGKMK